MKYPHRLDFKVSREQKDSLKELAAKLEYESVSSFLRAIANKKLIVMRP